MHEGTDEPLPYRFSVSISCRVFQTGIFQSVSYSFLVLWPEGKALFSGFVQVRLEGRFHNTLTGRMSKSLQRRCETSAQESTSQCHSATS